MELLCPYFGNNQAANQPESSNFFEFFMKHIYNPTAAITQRSTANALGTAMVSKFFMLLLLGFFLLVSRESFGQGNIVYGPKTFQNLDSDYHVQNIVGVTSTDAVTGQLIINTGKSEKEYEAYVAIKQSFNLKRGYTYRVSFDARAIDSNNGGPGEIAIYRANAFDTDWSTSTNLLSTGIVSKSSVMVKYSISFTATSNNNSVYLALKLQSDGGNQSELFVNNLIITETCIPNTPVVTEGSSCSIDVPIKLKATGAVQGIEGYKWYERENGPAILTGYFPEFTTESLPETRVYYVSIYNLDRPECESVKVPVRANVGGLLPPNVTMIIGSCEGSNTEVKTYQASGGTEGSYNWYRVVNNVARIVTVNGQPNGQPVTSSTLTRKTNQEDGLHYAVIVGATCSSEPFYFTVSKGYPSSPNDNATAVVCGNQITLTATGASLGESYKWYATVGGVAIYIGQGAIVTRDVIADATSYTVSKVNTASGCESLMRIAANITTTPILQPAPITGNAIVCRGTTGVIYSVPSINGSDYTWSIERNSGAGTATITSGSNPNQILVSYPNADYRGTIEVIVSNSCSNYTAKLAVQATNINSITSNIIEPTDLALNQPARFTVETNLQLNDIERIQWFKNETGSTAWVAGPIGTDYWDFAQMPGNIDGFRVAIRLRNPEALCLSTESYGNLNIEGFEANSFYVEDLPITPLPVEFVSFKAQRHTKGVNLTWVTASELDNKGFEIQVSNNAKDFTVIGFVESKVGTTSSKQYYNYIDTKAVSGTRYYRLKQVDFDGTSSYSPIKTVALDGYSANVSAYPNPFDDVVVVTLNGSEARTVQVVLLDAMGKVLQQRMEETAGNSISVDMTSVKTKGIYILHVLDNDMKHTFKLMKR